MVKMWKRLVAWGRATKVRIQYWLIKKLGGYTMPQKPTEINPRATLHLQHFQSVTTIDCYELYRHPGQSQELLEYKRQQLAHHLADALMRRAILYESCEDFQHGPGSIRLKATIYTLDAQEAADTVHRWYDNSVCSMGMFNLEVDK